MVEEVLTWIMLLEAVKAIAASITWEILLRMGDDGWVVRVGDDDACVESVGDDALSQVRRGVTALADAADMLSSCAMCGISFECNSIHGRLCRSKLLYPAITTQ